MIRSLLQVAEAGVVNVQFQSMLFCSWRSYWSCRATIVQCRMSAYVIVFFIVFVVILSWSCHFHQYLTQSRPPWVSYVAVYFVNNNPHMCSLVTCFITVHCYCSRVFGDISCAYFCLDTAGHFILSFLRRFRHTHVRRERMKLWWPSHSGILTIRLTCQEDMSFRIQTFIFTGYFFNAK